MKKPFAIFLAVGLTAVFSPQLMTALQHAVLAHGQQLIVTSPTESFSVTVWFVLGTCMCVALAAGTGFYLRRRAPLVRSTCVLLPVLIAAAVATILKVTQLDSAASAAMTLGFDSVIQLKQAGIHTIPWVGFAAGVSGVGVAILFARKAACPSKDTAVASGKPETRTA